jgi:transcriptional/translational regulatory protein YebC/TACO1
VDDARLLSAALSSGVPKDVVDRNLKKGSEAKQANFDE